MNRRMVWIERSHFRCWGCSECAWTFNPSSAPADTSLDEMRQNFELQRDQAFKSHICAGHPRRKSTRSKHTE
jgi:hypothetical protein